MAKADRIELFCQEILKGSSQRQAYYVAYPSSRNWKEASVDSHASRFAKESKVLERLQELRRQAEEENKISRNDIIAQLSTIGFSDIDPENVRPTDKIKALEVIAKLLGYDRQNNDNKDIMEKLDAVLGDIDVRADE